MPINICLGGIMQTKTWRYYASQPKHKYVQHRNYAQGRKDANGNPIEFRLTFEEWWDIWEKSGHWHERGSKRGQYCMSRYNDVGHYEVGNVFIQLSTNNTRQMARTPEVIEKMTQHLKGSKQSPEHIAKRIAARLDTVYGRK